MRYAIISDIHGNADALHVALDDIDARAVDVVVCLGDIVGYGAEPGRCVDLVRERAGMIVRGNHDDAAVDPRQANWFNGMARMAIQWTARQLSDEQRTFLRSLPYTMRTGEYLFVHSAPRDPEDMQYIMDRFDARDQAGAFPERVCFIGHSHRAAVFPLDPSISEYTPEHRFIINVGSVGQPRDGDSRLAYGLLDTVAGTYESIRLEYDIDAAADKIRLAGLPGRLSERLYVGY